MKELFRLPNDPSGFGDFGVSYVGTDAKVHFEYASDQAANVGEIFFKLCIYLSLNGDLDSQRELAYDRIFVEKFQSERYEGFNRYLFMLSGSDFQFEVVAQDCWFTESVDSTLIMSD